MGVAEYVLVFVSLIMGLAMADLLVSLHRLLRARRRVRWDWASPVLAAIVAMLILMIWWSQFPEEGDRAVTIGGFLPIFLELVLLFLLASAVLPDEVPPGGLSLKEHYQENAPYFWTLMSLFLGWATAFEGADALARDPTLDAALTFLANRAADLAMLALFVSLIFVRRRWWHAVVIAVSCIAPLAWLSRSIG